MSGQSRHPDPPDADGPTARPQDDEWCPPWQRAGVFGGRVTPRLVIGLAIMMLGLVLALDSLGIVNGAAIFRFWPLVLIAIGVVKWLSPTQQGSGGFVWIVAGVGFLLVTLGLMPITRIWAVILFFIGANIFWRALRPAARTAAEDPAAAIDMVAVLGGAKTVSRSTAFRGGQAMAALGGCHIDLRYASMPDGGQAVLDVFAFWGGVEVRVPEEWEVVNRVSAIMGGIDNKTESLPNANRRLVITGTVIMGGIEVKN